MGIVGDALQWLSDTATHVLATTGYAGLLLLMAAESMVLPVPSEAVMPFAGVLVAQGKMSWAGAILASSAGSLLGSWLGYLMGQYGLTPLVRRYGKYVLLREHHLDGAHRWFERRGAVAIFVCRFIPGVRHVVSIPAGSARMPLRPFLAASLAGATIWNTFLLWLGWKFVQDAGAVAAVKRNLDYVGLALLGLLVAYVVYEWRKGKKAKAAPA
ncbi:MAG: DedA family protein [Thermoplasmatota archaeon]